jgi:hypothetical protein
MNKIQHFARKNSPIFSRAPPYKQPRLAAPQPPEESMKSGTTVRSFNHILQEFVDELSETFSDYPQIQLFRAGLPGMLEKDEWYGVNTFMDALTPHGDKILNNDRSFFDEEIHLGMGLQLNHLWKEDLDDDTRDAIASYVSTLFMLGMTLKSITPDIMSKIEGIAKNAAMTMKKNGGQMDMASMLPGMIQQVGGLLGADGGDISGAMGGDMHRMMSGMMSQVSTVMGADLPDSLPSIEDCTYVMDEQSQREEEQGDEPMHDAA